MIEGQSRHRPVLRGRVGELADAIGRQSTFK
jgi:hypothetical protein